MVKEIMSYTKKFKINSNIFIFIKLVHKIYHDYHKSVNKLN